MSMFVCYVYLCRMLGYLCQIQYTCMKSCADVSVKLLFFINISACMLPTLTTAVNDDSDLKGLMEGHFHYHRLVWDPTGHTVSVYNISSTSPLHIILIRKKVGNCEAFFLRLKGISPYKSLIACVGELTAAGFKQKCHWVNDSREITINEGNIYGMQDECGPWYVTIYTPGVSNTTKLFMEVSEPYDPLAFRWFRVITNLAFLPALYLALKRRFYAETIIYTLTFILSGVSIFIFISIQDIFSK